MTSVARRTVFIEPSFDAWRQIARALLESGTPPEAIDLTDSNASHTALLFAPDPLPRTGIDRRASVPKRFIDDARIAACHRAPDRWNVLYRLLWRLQEERNLLRIDVDDDVAAFRRLVHEVKRDLHKMHAFVRFRKVDDSLGEHFVAWYEPAHCVLPLAAPFFAERFAIMRWAILTPDASVRWDPHDKQLNFGPGVSHECAAHADDFEVLWRTYYAAVFNPARTNENAMRREMPTRYWKNLPELDDLPRLLNHAGEKVGSMLSGQPRVTGADFLPAERRLPVLRRAIGKCEGCELHRRATQPVFGYGPAVARAMFIGEQPGDEEDRAGMPFIGPAGRLLNELFEEAGIDRSSLYLTNAVKHFKFVERGGRRLHENPRAAEIFACRPWLLAELDAVRPELVVCLGASASKALFGSNFGLMRERGKLLASPYAPRVIATIHPSAILRAADRSRSGEMRSMLLSDLKMVADTLRNTPQIIG
jgi:uracil-DNA glycosylase